MSIDEEKNDSKKILPKINWKKANEEDNKVWKKNLLHFNSHLKGLKIKRSPTHINLNNLYKSIKFNKKENSNDKTEQTTTNFISKNLNAHRLHGDFSLVRLGLQSPSAVLPAHTRKELPWAFTTNVSSAHLMQSA